MLKAFTYSEEHSGFAHVFKTSELRDNNLEFAWLLKKMLWLDKRTSALRLKFTFYILYNPAKGSEPGIGARLDDRPRSRMPICSARRGADGPAH